MKRNHLVLLIPITLLVSASVYYLISEHQNRQAARSLGMDYVRKEYAENDPLKVVATCNPLFGGNGYQIVLQNSHGESYYISIMLGPERNLISVDDLTEDVRQGTSVFPCSQ